MNDNTTRPSPNATSIGWQQEPSTRETYGLLQSCPATVVLLCWSSVCPNVAASNSGYFGKLHGKLSLFGVAILMPEAVLWIAVGQLHNAWRDKCVLRERRYCSWDLRHCFFVNMGCLFIQFQGNTHTPTTITGPSFPVNCTQLRYLVDMGYIVFPAITHEDIEMRNNSDGLSRTVAIAQVLWFTASTLACVAQGLPLTSLEITTSC